MSFAHLKWQVATLDSNEVQVPVQEWAKTLSVSPFLIEACLKRGLVDLKAIEEFLSPTPQLWHDPWQMHDMKKAVERIQRAIEMGESILIFGDYDADGITSTAILYETLEMLGAVVSYYLPNRFKDGYGPNQSVFEEAIQNGVTLLITVDCGIAAHQPIEWAMNHGGDVLICDHHEIPPVIPKAYAVVHPRHPEANYPFGDLSGAGVALKVAHALLGEFPEEMLDIACIGTVADLVSLTDENRTLVKLGLQQMRQTQRVGLLSWFETLQLATDTIDEKTIGFQLAPRLNALGRLGDASPGVNLLTTFDQEEASEIVTLMQHENVRRQKLVDELTAEAIALADQQKDQAILVLAQVNWHEGVLGIVASRVAEQLKKPTIVLSISQDGLLAKGSARSYGTFNLYKALSSCESLLRRFGGHHMAAGLTIETISLPAFMEKLNDYAQTYVQQLQGEQPLSIEQVLSIDEVTIAFIEEWQVLKPFGVDNPEPIFQIDSVQIKSKQRIGTQQQHLKLLLQEDEKALNVLAFQKGPWGDQLNVQARVAVAGTLELNEWQNKRLPQLLLKDIQVKDPLIFDWRMTRIRPQHLQVEHAVYLVERPQLQPKVQQKIPQTSIVMTMQEWLHAYTELEQYDALVLLDCPISKEVVERFRRVKVQQKLYIIAYTPHSIMTAGIPNRERFKQVYHYIKTHPNLPYNHSTGTIATYLKIPLSQFKVILKVFFELKFVIIVDGFLKLNPTPSSVDLFESSLMKELQEQLWLEKVFIYSQFKELTTWLTEPE